MKIIEVYEKTLAQNPEYWKEIGALAVLFILGCLKEYI